MALSIPERPEPQRFLVSEALRAHRVGRVAWVGAILEETPGAPASDDVTRRTVSESLSMLARSAKQAVFEIKRSRVSIGRFIAKSEVSPVKTLNPGRPVAHKASIPAQ